MKKVVTNDFIIKLTFIFLLIQPILDIKVFYDYEILGVTIPTIIRLIFFAILFLLFIFNKKRLKLPIIYFVLFFIYSILHLINANNNYINILGKYSIPSEVIYLIRLAIPMMFILFSYNYKVEFNKISKLFFIVALIISSIITVTNLLGISYPSYSQTQSINGNFFDWMFLSKIDNGYYNLATKGLFGYANPLSGLMCLILPILLYSFYKKSNLKKFLIIYLFLISMLIVGTRISSYMTIIILVVMLIIYLVLSSLFKLKIDNTKTLTLNILLIILLIPFFINAPIMFSSDRKTSESEANYATENKLLTVVNNYREKIEKGVSKEEEEEINKFIKENYKYFSINDDLAPDKYLYEDYLIFWMNYFEESYKNQNNTRDFELYLYKHIYEHNNNKLDMFLGYGYSQNFNDGVVLERDFVYHFYTLGIFGLILFIIPYYAILIYSIIKVLTNLKEKLTLENVTYILTIGILVSIAIIGGNIFDFFGVNIFLSFICGQLLYNMNAKKDWDVVYLNKCDNIAVSVVVPVYNVEKYIDKCLNSLVNQTLKNIEIIVVNDGSPDNSSKIIEKYENKYPNLIKSYVKENGGLSDARNFGIEKCSGEYIAFLDSDDYVNYDMYEKLYKKAVSKNFDVVVCDTLYDYETKKKFCSSKINEDLFKKEDIKKMMVDFYPAVWNKIYKKSLFDNGIRFKKGIWFEDVEFIYRLIPSINSVGVVNEALINYVQREGAITKTFDKRVYDYITDWNSIIDYYKSNNLFDEYRDELEYSCTRYLFATFVKSLSKMNDNDEFERGVNLAISKVSENFPNYKKNKYLKKITLKNIYLRNFNLKLANVFFKTKNK